MIKPKEMTSGTWFWTYLSYFSLMKWGILQIYYLCFNIDVDLGYIYIFLRMKNKNWKLRYFALKVNKSILPVVFCWLSLSAKVSEKSDNERMSFSHEGFWGCCGSPATVLFAVQNRHSTRAVRLLCSITDLNKILQHPYRS